MKHFKFVLFAFLFTFAISAVAQMSVTSYSIYALGVNTSQAKKISGELKLFANQGDMESLMMEVDGFYNFKQGDYHRFSVGVGIKFGPFYGYDQLVAFTVPVQLEIMPLQDFKKLSFLIELAPEISPEDNPNLRHLWGIRYRFGK